MKPAVNKTTLRLVVVGAIITVIIISCATVRANAEHSFSFQYTSGETYRYTVMAVAINADEAHLAINYGDGAVTAVALESIGGGNFSTPSGGYSFTSEEPITSLGFYVDDKWVAGVASYIRDDGSTGYTIIGTAPEPEEIDDPPQYMYVYLPLVAK